MATCGFRGHCSTVTAAGEPLSPILGGRRCLTCPGHFDVVVSPHALDRVVERSGRLRGDTIREVKAALLSGRASFDLPQWARSPRLSSLKAGRAAAWSEDRSRLYILARGEHGGAVVLTCFTAEMERAA